VAFPCNIGLDEVAAHSTPYPDSDYVLRKGTLVKVDLGVEIEGHVADTAITVALPGADEGLVVAAQRALEEALRVVRAGVRVRAIGEAISRTIGSMGYRPISNLSGLQAEAGGEGQEAEGEDGGPCEGDCGFGHRAGRRRKGTGRYRSILKSLNSPVGCS
jgi:methionine aminopeptidase